MEKLIMLGTGHAMTLDCFNTCFVLDGGLDRALLVDTGGGLQILRQLRDAKVDFMRVHDIFISHKHTDHLLGLFWIVRMAGRYVTDPAYGEPLNIYMHRELAELAGNMLREILPERQAEQLGRGIRIVTVEDGEERTVAGCKTRFMDLFSPTDRQYGFKMRLNNGKTLCFMGDVPVNERLFDTVRDTDWLLCDAFCLDSQLRRRGGEHASVLSAAQTAERLNAHSLLLYHCSDDDLAHRREKYTAEARTAFGGDIYVPYDLDVIEL